MRGCGVGEAGWKENVVRSRSNREAGEVVRVEWRDFGGRARNQDMRDVCGRRRERGDCEKRCMREIG